MPPLNKKRRTAGGGKVPGSAAAAAAVGPRGRRRRPQPPAGGGRQGRYHWEHSGACYTIGAVRYGLEYLEYAPGLTTEAVKLEVFE